MNIKNELLFLEEWVVVDFLRQIDDYFSNSKYIELLIALSLVKFCERQWNSKCWIGLEIQNKYKKDIPNVGTATFKELKEIIVKKVEESTFVDVTIAKMPSNKEYGVSQGMNFQLKRFGKDKNHKDTKTLIQFLNNKKKEYPKSKTNLVVLIETAEEINLKLLQSNIDTSDYPFEKIILVGFSESRYINYYGIWPESGYSKYDLNKFDFDF